MTSKADHYYQQYEKYQVSLQLPTLPRSTAVAPATHPHVAQATNDALKISRMQEAVKIKLIFSSNSINYSHKFRCSMLVLPAVPIMQPSLPLEGTTSTECNE